MTKNLIFAKFSFVFLEETVTKAIERDAALRELREKIVTANRSEKFSWFRNEMRRELNESLWRIVGKELVIDLMGLGVGLVISSVVLSIISLVLTEGTKMVSTAGKMSVPTLPLLLTDLGVALCIMGGAILLSLSMHTGTGLVKFVQRSILYKRERDRKRSAFGEGFDEYQQCYLAFQMLVILAEKDTEDAATQTREDAGVEEQRLSCLQQAHELAEEFIRLTGIALQTRTPEEQQQFLCELKSCDVKIQLCLRRYEITVMPFSR